MLTDAQCRNAVCSQDKKRARFTDSGGRWMWRTILQQVLKFEKDVIEAQLAHKGQITHGGAYDRATHVEDRTDMLQVWADYLDKLARGADVIPLRTAA